MVTDSGRGEPMRWWCLRREQTAQLLEAWIAVLRLWCASAGEQFQQTQAGRICGAAAREEEREGFQISCCFPRGLRPQRPPHDARTPQEEAVVELCGVRTGE